MMGRGLGGGAGTRSIITWRGGGGGAGIGLFKTTIKIENGLII